MMKHTTIKQLGCLLCIAILLVGCTSSVTQTPESDSKPEASSIGWNLFLVVEDITYDTIGNYLLNEKKLIYSFILVFPREQHYYFCATRYIDGEYHGEIYSQKVGDPSKGYDRINIRHFKGNEKPDDGTMKIANVPFHHVHFINNGKIVLQKSYEELGIDVSDPQRAFDKENLFPILGKIIRENVPPQENDDRNAPTQNAPNEE